MLKLGKSTSATKETDTALAAGETTRDFLCQSEHLVFSLTGDMASRTVRLQVSPDGSNWFTYYAKDASGTPAAADYTATHVPTQSDCFSDIVIGAGQRFRFTIPSGTGSGTADVDIFVSGDVTIY